MGVTREQVIAARWGARFHFGECTRTIGPRGGITESIEEWRPNGAVKTWTTRPAEFRMPIKYGMREYAYLDHANAHAFHRAEDCDPTVIDNRPAAKTGGAS